jgi:hypothetical protein
VGLGLEALYREHFKMAFGLNTKLYFSYPQFLDHDRYTKNMRQDVFIDDVYAQYFRGNEIAPLVSLQMGYFKFKYDPDIRNLGEYLFRSGTYPAFLDNSFDFPQQRLLGFHGQSNLFSSLKTDLLFVSQTVFPAMNWSLAGLAEYDVTGRHFLTIGAGVDFAHLFDVYTHHSFPASGGDPTELHSDVNARYIANISATGDTTLEYYTFKGTKVMGRIAFDPKAFISWKGFGRNDLRLYAEACVIGLKSYPDSGYIQGGTYTLVAPSYDKIPEKTPVVIGFNIPTFKILDVLNCEVEYFGARYYNDASSTINKGSNPLPYNVFDYFSNPLAPKKNDYKWSVYVKRTLFDGHFAIIGQVARDHMRLPCAQYDLEYWNDLLVTKNDWWWVLKTSWMF